MATSKKINMDLTGRKKALEEGEGEEKKTMTITKEDLEGISDKEFAEAKKEDKAKLHSLMDEGFRKARTKLEELLKKKHLGEYWKMVSKTIEDTWLEHLKLDKDVAKKLKGRGEVKITKEVPKGRDDKVKEGSIKNSLMYKAIDNLKQARRCEQINHRITKGRNEAKEKREKYWS